MFSGIGGIELGFERQGFKTKWFVENEPYAQCVLKKRFPNTVIYDDVTNVDFRTVPKVDILTGGFPCQDISNAGKRTGIEGSRSSLWTYFCQAIGIIRPKFAFIENVSALLRRGLEKVLCDLASIGYDAEWHCVSASAIGAPHQRDRIFIIAYSNPGLYINQKEQIQTRGQATNNQIIRDAANTDNKRLSEQQSSRKKQQSRSGFNRLSVCEEWREINPSKTFLRRGDDGISNRIHRIRCLGNAVVPVVAEVFAKAIKETNIKAK